MTVEDIRRYKAAVREYTDIAVEYTDKAMNHRPSRWIIIGAGAIAAVVALTTATSAAVSSLRQGRITAAAEQLAEQLQAKERPSNLVGDNIPDDGRFSQLLDGMGDLAYTVSAGERLPETPNGDVPVVMEHSWQIQPDKEPWTFQTVVDFRKDGSDWQPVWNPTMLAPGLENNERLRAIRLRPKRGTIRGAGGAPIVVDRQVQRIGLDKAMVPEERQEAAAKNLAAGVGIDPNAFAERVKAGGPQAFVEATVLRPGDPQINILGSRNIPGLRQVPDTLPLPPATDFAAEILGKAGNATAEKVEESGGSLKAQDVVGLSGLQESQNHILQGQVGYVVEAVNIDSDAPRDVHRVDETNGAPLKITLDVQMQRDAEQIMSQVDTDASLVAMDPQTGNILAVANSPGSDGMPNAVLGQYPPGSIFKVVTALALLRNGLTPESTVQCPAITTVDGKEFKNHSEYPSNRLGDITLTQAMAYSCNTAFVDQAKNLSLDQLKQAAEALGVVSNPDVGMATKLVQLPEGGSAAEVVAAALGQGQVVMSPLGATTMVASVAAGRPIAPTILQGHTPQGSGGDGVTAEQAGQLKTMLRAVVTDGTAGALKNVPGGEVFAKTGTAEYGDAQPLKTHAWMVAARENLAVAVFVADGDSGGKTAGPLVERFFKYAAR